MKFLYNKLDRDNPVEIFISLLWTFFVLLGALSVIVFKFLFKKR